ncbi:Fc receptor-like protein 4 isoform X2 [Dendropsophus ebraccatus]|uniref:Fc receptor-like protein 4 isoform X2 n=1 Tax=Dendropsophus ebraccatus TaxID=150705 RepID=UPI003831FEC6
MTQNHCSLCVAVTMSALRLITLTLLIADHSGEAVRPSVTLTPNWEHVLYGDSVTLTCDLGSAAPENQTYYWYKGDEPMGTRRNQRNITIQSASWLDEGSYQCHSGTSDISHPLRLRVSQADVILQRPPSIHVGQSLTLRCHSLPGYKVISTTFYKDDKEIQTPTRDSELHIKRVDGDVTAKYRCGKVIQRDDGSTHTFSYESYIHVTRAAVRPVVTFTPNWRNLLSGDAVTIMCDVASDDQETQIYYWYKDDKPAPIQQRSFTVKSASWSDAGDYMCYTRASEISYPAKLTVNHAFLILQRPQDIVEGDSLTLRCHSRSEYRVIKTTFYRDDCEIKSSVSDSLLHINNVDGAVTGKYKCTKGLQDYDGTFQTLSDESFVSVSELISYPKIKGSSDSIVEDDELTLTCTRRLNPLRDHTELRYSFFRNGREVKNLGSSDTYKVRSVQLEDSGNYTCEVVTPTLRKRSEVSYVHVQELFSYPEIKVPPLRILGGGLTLTCATRLNPLRLRTELLFTFYRNGRKVQEVRLTNTYRIQAARLEDSGNYSCEVRSGSTRKRSNILYVHIQDYTLHNLIRLLLSGLTLVAAAAVIFFHYKSGDDE